MNGTSQSMNGLVSNTSSPYRISQKRDPAKIRKSEFTGDNVSDTSSYVNGSHEDVLWSFEQQVNTMKKYGVVANSVEFEELEKSLDEELKKYKMYDELKNVRIKDDTLRTTNTSQLVHNGSQRMVEEGFLCNTLSTVNRHTPLPYIPNICDSPPSSPDDVLNSKPSDIDRLYKQFYRENSLPSSDHQFKAPSDLDYYPIKQTPKVYPKSPVPKPAPKTFGASSSALATNGGRPQHASSGGLSRSRSNSSKHGSGAGGPPLSNPLREDGMTGSYNCRELGGRSRHGSGTASSSCGSQANIYNPLTHSNDVLSGRYSQNSGRHSGSSDQYSPGTMSGVSPPLGTMPGHKDSHVPGPRKIVNTETEHFFCSTSAISPPLQMPTTRGHASSMPVLDTDIFEHKNGPCSNMVLGSRTVPHTPSLATSLAPSHATLHNNMMSQDNMMSLNKMSLKQYPESNSAGSSSTTSEPELRDIINILTSSSNLALVNTAAGALQHLCYSHDGVKNKIRESGAIPILVHMLSLDDLVCISSLGVLRNLSFGRNNHLNRIAIQDAHGITLLVQLLNTTQSFEIQELVTGVFWNLSSSDTLKLPILKQALESIIKNIIIPQSGWKESHGFSFDTIHYTSNSNIGWTTVFRNATGCLKNLSSAGIEGRTLLRMCNGLVDSLLWTVKSAQGKNDVDNKAVENAVCILRNLSYRLDAEVAPEVKYWCTDDWRSRGLGGGMFRRNPGLEESKKKKMKGKEVNVTPLPEHTSGVGLLWQPSVIRVYLDLLLECSNPETLEGACGALQNLTACTWEPTQTIRETIRKEKGLSVITSLLRLPNDLVVRATAFCLRNLAIDPKNKELLGKHATPDLVKRLPGGDGAAGITDMTISGVVAAICEIVSESSENCRLFRDNDGVQRLLEIAKSQDAYTKHCVYTANKILSSLWEVKDIRRLLKSLGWNVSSFTRLQGLDKSDGMEYDTFRIADNSDHQPTSPDPTFDSHAFQSHHGNPDMISPSDHVISPSNHVISPSNHVPLTPQGGQLGAEGYHLSIDREHNVSRTSNRSPYQDYPPELPPRGHTSHQNRNYPSGPPSKSYTAAPSASGPPSKSYTVADSWV